MRNALGGNEKKTYCKEAERESRAKEGGLGVKPAATTAQASLMVSISRSKSSSSLRTTYEDASHTCKEDRFTRERAT